jgi:hypothetical protein
MAIEENHMRAYELQQSETGGSVTGCINLQALAAEKTSYGFQPRAVIVDEHEARRRVPWA